MKEINPSEESIIANAIAADLAEYQLAADIAGAMVRNPDEKARAIRQLSESNADQANGNVQEYRAAKRIITNAASALLRGCGGYKLVEQTEESTLSPVLEVRGETAPKDRVYRVASHLSAEFAEKYVASDIADTMLCRPREKAKAIRKLAESGTETLDPSAQAYLAAERAIYLALYTLLEKECFGYRLVKQGAKG